MNRSIKVQRKQKCYHQDDIIEAVCQEHGLTLEQIRSKNRKLKYCIPRQQIMCLLEKFTPKSMRTIGEIVLRDHATVIHSREQVVNDCLSSEVYKEQLQRIIGEIVKKNLWRELTKGQKTDISL